MINFVFFASKTTVIFSGDFLILLSAVFLSLSFFIVESHSPVCRNIY